MSEWTPPETQRLRPMAPVDLPDPPPMPLLPVGPVRTNDVTPLRPLTAWEVLTGAGRVNSRSPRLMLLIGLLTGAITHAVAIVVWVVLWPVVDSTAGVLLASVLTVVLLLTGSVCSAGCGGYVVTRAAAGYLSEGPDLWEWIAPVRWRLLGLAALLGTAVPVGLVLGVVPGVLIGVALCLAAPVVVVERVTIREALERSRALVSGAWWRTFRVLAFVAFFPWLFLYLVVRLPTLYGDTPGDSAPVGWLFLAAVLLTLLNAGMTELGGSAIGMLYLDRALTAAHSPVLQHGGQPEHLEQPQVEEARHVRDALG